MTTTPPAGRPDAFGAVSSSFGQAWQRMTTLLFTGPGANVPNWMRWGIIILLAGLTGTGGGSGYNFPGGGGGDESVPSLGDLGLPQIQPAQVFALMVPLIALAIVLVLVFVYLQSRFRFVFLEGIIAGEPRIGGVFGRTGRPGGRYFGFLLLATVVQVAAIGIPLALLFPALRRVGDQPNFGEIIALIAPVLRIGVPIILIVGILRWYVHAFALPYMWLRDEGVVAAIRSSWRTVSSEFGSFALFVLLYIVAAFAAAIVGTLIFCCSVCIWGIPGLLMVVSAAVTLAVTPWLFVITGPVILALGLLIGWIIATLTAPIPMLFRSWSLAFVALQDPEVARLAMAGRGEPGGAAGAVPPPPPAAPPPPLPPSEPPGPGTTDPGI